LAPQVGFEPTTLRLTAEFSIAEQAGSVAVVWRCYQRVHEKTIISALRNTQSIIQKHGAAVAAYSSAMIAPPSLNGAASSTEPNVHARAEFNIAVGRRRFEHDEAIGGGRDCQMRVVLGHCSSAQ